MDKLSRIEMQKEHELKMQVVKEVREALSTLMKVGSPEVRAFILGALIVGMIWFLTN